MAYARDDIDKVRQATDLVDLVASVTKVKRSGRSFMAICPFHEEKSPSLSLDPGRGLYHCFGCQKGGDVFTFLSETQGLDFNEAVEELARRAGIEITSDAGADRRRGKRNTLHDAVRRAIEVYHNRLRTGGDAGPARAYLRSRGYDGDVVDEYRIGYAPEAWDTLVRELRAGGVDERTMMEAGLARRGRGGNLYDYFRGRVVFPIHDVRGEPVGFGGRILTGDGAKYVNSPDSAIYNKSRLLYGLDRARVAISRSNRSVVVEGYTDVIALHAAGVPEAVATCGTALTDEHFDLLRRFADRVVLAFDADSAGTEAARRTAELDAPVRLDLDMRVAVMPDGGDPADVVQAGRIDEVRTAIAEAVPVLEFILSQEFGRINLREAEGKARALHIAAARIPRIKDQIARSEYEALVAKMTGIDRADVEKAMRSSHQRDRVISDFSGPPEPEAVRRDAAFLRVMLMNPDGAEVISPDIFVQAEAQLAAEVVSGLRQQPGVEVDITNPEIPESSRHLMRRALLDPEPLSIPDILAHAQRRRIDAEIDRLEQEIAVTDSGDERYSNALNRLIALQQEKRRL
jgi:DNA primase